MRSAERWTYLARAPYVLWSAALRGRYGFTFDWMPFEVAGMGVGQRLNLLRAGLNLAYRRLRPWSWPLHMQVELTSYCNLRCPVCPVGTGELRRRPSAMDPARFERLLGEVGPYLLTLSLWAWGEPLLHPELEAILAVAKRYPMGTLLSTNGQNLDAAPVQKALRRHPPTYLIVAIDGLSDETNTRFRQGARLQPALDGVRRLAVWKERSGSRLPRLHLRFMVMRHNEHELPRVTSFAREHGFDLVTIRTLSIIDAAEDPHRGLVPEGKDWRAYEYRDGERVRRRDFVCQHAFSFPTVYADGTVVPCEQDFNATQAYGVFPEEGTFRDLWWGDRARRVRKAIREDYARFAFCRNCPYADRPVSSCSVQAHELRAPGS